MSKILLVFAMVVFAGMAEAQVDDICAEAGLTPSLDSPFAHVPYVFGRVILKGFDRSSNLPRVVVTLIEGEQSAARWAVGASGNYCFRRKVSGGTLLVEVDGVELARRTLTSFGSAQQREDFEIIHPVNSQKPVPPAAISAKFAYPENQKTVGLYKKAAEAIQKKDRKKAIQYLKEVVALDPADFIGWAKLGSQYFEQNALADSEAAFRRSLELKVEYTPAWLSVGMIRVAQKQYEAAIEIFKHAASLDPKSSGTFRLLGEAYLQARQGTLGAQALNEAIRLDPIGMAECHLLLAHLYQLADAKHLAAREYGLFLEKVPEHPERKKFERFIKDNPEKSAQN